MFYFKFIKLEVLGSGVMDFVFFKENFYFGVWRMINMMIFEFFFCGSFRILFRGGCG